MCLRDSSKTNLFTRSELLVVACYYFLVVKNVADTIAANEDRLADIEMCIRDSPYGDHA